MLFFLIIQERRVFLILQRVDHLERIFVGEDGEVGLWLKEEYLAAFLVFPDTLDAFASHGDAALAVGKREEFVTGAVEDQFVALVCHKACVVFEEYVGFSLALCCHAGDIVDGDKLVACGEAEEDFTVVHIAVMPAFLDGEDVVFEVFVVAMLETALVPAFADELVVIVVFDESALEATVDIVAGDETILADAFPPAAVAVVVEPVGHFGGVAVALIDDVDAIFDTHIVRGLFHKTAVFGVEFPQSVTVALVVFSTGKHVSLFVIGLVEAAFSRFGIGIADADGAVVVEIGEGAGLEAVDEFTLIDFGTVLVGANPVSLTASLFVSLVLRHSRRGGQHKCGGEE